nr:hypothetical protein [Tanacetum cinerariifolium]
MSKVLQERGFRSLPSSTKTNLRDHVKSILIIVKADTSSIHHIGSHQYVVSTRQNCILVYETKQTTILFLSHLNDCYSEDKKESYGPQFSKANSYGALHIDKSIPRKEKDPGSFTLPCYINNVCFNNALADLGASEGEVIEEFRARNDARMDKLENKENNVVEALMNIHIFVGNFSILTDFAVLEDMDTYRDEGMGDVILGEPLLREVRINARRFERMITIYSGNEKVTYQMVRLHPRF